MRLVALWQHSQRGSVVGSYDGLHPVGAQSGGGAASTRFPAPQGRCCAGSPPYLDSAPRSPVSSHSDRPVAGWQNALATSKPCRGCSRVRGLSRVKPCQRPPSARSARARACAPHSFGTCRAPRVHAVPQSSRRSSSPGQSLSSQLRIMTRASAIVGTSEPAGRPATRDVCRSMCASLHEPCAAEAGRCIAYLP